jgi:hypothetical protein
MARALADIEKEICALTSGDRQQLLKGLLKEKSWLTEVQRRSRELGEGMIKAVPAHEVFDRLRADLRK